MFGNVTALEGQACGLGSSHGPDGVRLEGRTNQTKPNHSA